MKHAKQNKSGQTENETIETAFERSQMVTLADKKLQSSHYNYVQRYLKKMLEELKEMWYDNHQIEDINKEIKAIQNKQ